MSGFSPNLAAALMAPANSRTTQFETDADVERRRRIMAYLLASNKPEKAGGGGMPGMDSLPGLDSLNAGGGGGGGGFGGMGSGGAGGSPWDMLFSGLGQAQGAIQGNDPNTPMVPGNRHKYGSDNALIGAGGPIGGAVGSIFGFGGAGKLAGQNVGATLSDIGHGDIHNLGLDVSQNLPPLPGMRAEGWKGLVNGATGLPFGTLLGKIFG